MSIHENHDSAPIVEPDSSGLIRIRRALISVSDKTDIVPLAARLAQTGCEIISTGGTRQVLEAARIPVTDITSVTRNPEAFAGRMKTISFRIESALLFDREKDAAEAAALGIEPIDLVVCNLYPFARVLAEGAGLDTLIENIDIGGPTMIRAAAKNFKYVTVLTAPPQYEAFLHELDAHGGTTYAFRKQLMADAFAHTADYDALIADAMDRETGRRSLRLHFAGGRPLRYGENSHQTATWYWPASPSGLTLADMVVHQGKPLSYNNILDIHGAVRAVRHQPAPACAVVKHTNTCGVAVAGQPREALELAWAGDPVSAFGSIIAFNAPVDRDTVAFLDLDDKAGRKFVEVIIAPGYTPEALAYLAQAKNLRVISLDVRNLPGDTDYRFIGGTLLAQSPDDRLYTELQNVTREVLDVEADKDLLRFGLEVVKHIKSNAIAIVGEVNGRYALWGMGAGQPNRLVATRLAIEKATDFIKKQFGGHAENASFLSRALLVSDAFFPFPDNVELAAAAGIRRIVQPGGSIRDKAVIEACDRLGVAMVFSGLRHFKH